MLFDQGRRSEALRIALQLRVLFHDTKMSTSLLRQMGKLDVKILSSSGGSPPMAKYTIQYGALIISERGPDSMPRLRAPLGDGPPTYRFVLLSDWLDELVFVRMALRLTRHDLFKWAANRDGGGHVDIERLPDEYEAFKATAGWAGVVVAGRPFAFDDAHLVALRQMGYEVLQSPDLRALTG